MAVLFLAEFQLFAQRVEINNHRCRNYNKNVRGSNLNRYTFFAFPFDYWIGILDKKIILFASYGHLGRILFEVEGL